MRTTSFNKFLERLRAFRVQNPESWPSQRSAAEGPLGKWCAKQRYRRKLGKLSKDRMASLDSMGFPWQPYEESWGLNYQNLLRYRRVNPTKWPAAKEMFEGRKIGLWCVAQRQLEREHRLESKRKRCLDQISFPWEFKNPDLTGKTFSRLTVLRQCETRTAGKRLWVCACSCGRTTLSSAHRLQSGKHKSCGCLLREKAAARMKSVQAASARRRLQSAVQVQSRVDRVHGEGTIRLVRESYSSVFSQAEFVHRTYGSWRAKPISVYRGSSHPRDGRDRTNTATAARRLTEEAIALRLPPHLKIKSGSLYHRKGKAIFIDEDFGEWSADVSNVLAGHGHPGRGVRKKVLSIERTNLQKYGVKYVAQVAEFALKAARAQNKILERRHWKTNHAVQCHGGWEAAVVDYLNYRRINYEWQPKVFKIPREVLTTAAGNETTFRPDLFLPDEGRWIEIKGFFREDAMKKWAWFCQVHPNSELWDQRKLLELGIFRQSGRRCV